MKEIYEDQIVNSFFFYQVWPGHRAVIFDRFNGLLPEVYKEGTRFLIPFVQSPRIFDIRTTPRVTSSETFTKGNHNPLSTRFPF